MTTTNTPIVLTTTAAWTDDKQGRLLFNLRKYGHLDTAQLAFLLYSTTSGSQRQVGLDTATRYAQQLCSELVNTGLITSSARRGHPTVFSVTVKGAEVLRNKYSLNIKPERAPVRKVKKVGGIVKIVINNHRHAANWAAIHLGGEGCTKIWSEREIAIGPSTKDIPKGMECVPFKAMDKKQPDVLAVHKDTPKLMTWVEVECTHRNSASLRKLAYWLVWSAFNPDVAFDVPLSSNDRYLLHKVRFVIANKDCATFIARLRVAIGNILDADGIPKVKDVDAWAQTHLEFATAPPYCDYWGEEVYVGWPETAGYRIESAAVIKKVELDIEFESKEDALLSA